MSARWQFYLLVAVSCAILLGGPVAHRARAQCSHGGGFMPRYSQGGFPQQNLLQTTLLQQQMLQQQQQQLLLVQQQVRQQQLLQTARLNRQMRDLADKGPEALKAALRDPKAEMRLLAALTVGKHGPALTDELIELLTDDNASVRQAARRGLIRLNTSAGRRNVDFGPAEGSNQVAQKISARKWRTWFEQQQAKVANLKSIPARAPAAPPKVVLIAAEASADRLSKELIDAPADRRDAVLSKLRDSKGAIYTQALSESIPQLTGANKAQARDALAERMTRMTAATLTDKLGDANPEVRRAAALACAMKEMNARIPDLIALLEDADPAVPPAARAALTNLTGQDFGSITVRDPAGQTRVAAAWKTWLRKQGGQ